MFFSKVKSCLIIWLVIINYELISRAGSFRKGGVPSLFFDTSDSSPVVTDEDVLEQLPFLLPSDSLPILSKPNLLLFLYLAT